MQPSNTIPEIEISPGWYVSDLTSPHQCDDALAVLTEAIASIEYQLHLEKYAGDEGVQREAKGPAWEARARSSLTWRKHARDAVQRKRSSMLSLDRRVVAYLTRVAPDLIEEAISMVKREDQ